MKTFYKYLVIFIFLLSFSCKKSEETKHTIITQKENLIKEIIITEEFKLEFLNDILNNKKDKLLFPYEDKNPTITYESLEEIEYKGIKEAIYQQIVGKPSTLPEYINFLFKENDSIFIIKQLKNNKDFKAHKLSKHGYYYIDSKKDNYYDKGYSRINSLSNDSIQKILSYRKKHRQLILYNLIFNKKLNKAYISIYYPGNYSIDLIYINQKNKWHSEKVLTRHRNMVSN